MSDWEVIKRSLNASDGRGLLRDLAGGLLIAVFLAALILLAFSCDC